MRTPLRKIGNSQGLILPKPLLAQIGVEGDEIDMSIEDNAIVLRRPRKPREGWAEAAAAAVRDGEDVAIWEYFGNEGDEELWVWE